MKVPIRSRPSLLVVALLALLRWSLACEPVPPESGEGEGEGEGEEGEGEGEEGGAIGEECTFNSDCAASLRCGCEGGWCLCEEGARGVGVSGVDVCVDENDCASALCVEDAEGAYTCSGPCETPADCGPRLPLCVDIAFLGRVCVREPPG